MSAKVVEANEKWGTSDANDETAYNLAFNTPLPFFQHVEQFPERAERFASCMTEVMSSDGYNIRHLVKGFPWDGLEAGSMVVDVRLALICS